jgi:hypothetical protein
VLVALNEAGVVARVEAAREGGALHPHQSSADAADSLRVTDAVRRRRGKDAAELRRRKLLKTQGDRER